MIGGHAGPISESGRNLFSGAALGAFVGLLLGLSVSDLVAAVGGGLVAIIGAFFGLSVPQGGSPSAELDRLRHSSERLPTVGARQVTSLFAASLESQAQGSVRCGSITFTKMRTRSFADIARTTDDPVGL